MYPEVYQIVSQKLSVEDNLSKHKKACKMVFLRTNAFSRATYDCGAQIHSRNAIAALLCKRKHCTLADKFQGTNVGQ